MRKTNIISIPCDSIENFDILGNQDLLQYSKILTHISTINLGYSNLVDLLRAKYISMARGQKNLIPNLGTPYIPNLDKYSKLSDTSSYNSISSNLKSYFTIPAEPKSNSFYEIFEILVFFKKDFEFLNKLDNNNSLYLNDILGEMAYADLVLGNSSKVTVVNKDLSIIRKDLTEYLTSKCSLLEDPTINLDTEVISKMNIQKILAGSINKGYDLIVYGNFTNSNNGFNETSAAKTLLSKVITSIYLNSFKGCSIIKFNGATTLPLAKIIKVASLYYNSIKLFKPKISSFDNLEQYLMLIDYKYEHNNKKVLESLINLEKLLEQMCCLPINTQLLDIFPNIQLKTSQILPISQFNMEINSKNIVTLNTMLKQFNKVKDTSIIKEDLSKKDTGCKLWLELVTMHLG